MPVNVNLLPPELSVSKSLNDLIKTLRALGVIAIAAFLVFGVGVGVFFAISTVTLGSINANVGRLKSQVSSQEKSEQQIVLLKDRITKITSVLTIPNSLLNLTAIGSFLSKFSGSVSIDQMQIDPAAIVLLVNLKTNSDLSTFLGLLENSAIFKSVNLTSFSFSPSSGYSLEVSVVRK